MTEAASLGRVNPGDQGSRADERDTDLLTPTLPERTARPFPAPGGNILPIPRLPRGGQVLLGEHGSRRSTLRRPVVRERGPPS